MTEQKYIAELYCRDISRQIYYGRYITAGIDILRYIYTCYGRYITADMLWHTYITADILWQIYYGNYIMADTLRQIYYAR